MKRFKKMMALVIATMMIAMYAVVPTFAADNYTLTINNTEVGHTYTAYQIFKGSKADTSQVSYAPVGNAAEYDATKTYYVKNGADYDITTVASAEAFNENRAKLYVRTGDSALGDPVWGADITTAGKVALYNEYGIKDEGNANFTAESTNLDKAANIIALLKAIADEENKNSSESDKAVRFANVFFETVVEDGAQQDPNNPGSGNKVQAKEGLLNTNPDSARVKEATGTSVAFTDLASGYYLVNDSYTAKEGEVNGIDYSISRIAVQVVGNTTINNKADKIKAEKKIKTSEELINSKANELGIGRVVEYEVTEVVPNYDGYNYYYFDMRDKMSDGLTFNKDSVKVTVGGTEITKLTAPATSQDGKGYYLYADKTADTAVLNANGNSSTFVIAFENIMKFNVGDPIVVTYSANVNSNAITGINPNTNEVKVDFSNDPTKSEKHDKDEDHPGVPAYDTNTPVGTTPGSYTDTYTTKLTIHKTDENGEALANVEFTLTGTAKDTVVKNDTVYELDPAGTFYMLKDGTYTDRTPQEEATLTETTGNSGWVEIGATETYAGTDVRVVQGKKLRPFVITDDQGKTHYVIVEGNAATYASTSLRYKPVTKSTTADVTDTYNVAMVGKTDANGNLEFSQLGAGTYTLSETEVLPGYNDIQDITFTIECALPNADAVIAGTEKATWTVKDISPNTAAITAVETGEAPNKTATGEFEVTIENNKGPQLPSTGGIGTTLFYLIGGLLVIGAGVVLVTRRRVNSEE